MRRSRSMYPVGLLGIAIGMLVGLSNREKVHVPIRPVAIISEDRNSDGFSDLVQYNEDGSETIFYASRSKEGKIEYRLQE